MESLNIERLLVFGPVFLAGAAGLAALLFGIKNKKSAVFLRVVLSLAFMIFYGLLIYAEKKPSYCAGALIQPLHLGVSILFFAYFLLAEKAKAAADEAARIFMLLAVLCAVLSSALVTQALAFVAAATMARTASPQAGLKAGAIIYAVAALALALAFTALPQGRAANFVFLAMAGSLAAAACAGTDFRNKEALKEDKLFFTALAAQVIILAKIILQQESHTPVLAVWLFAAALLAALGYVIWFFSGAGMAAGGMHKKAKKRFAVSSKTAIVISLLFALIIRSVLQ